MLILFFGVTGLYSAYAQLGFCSGNSGDAIYMETFGSGISNGPALPSGTTSYTFANTQPGDGFYTISSNTSWFDWHNTTDHTVGDTNGRALIVNADFTPGEFYRTTISGLCEGTTYEFSAWLLNLLPPGGYCGTGIPINVKFQIWDSTDSILLVSGDTGDIQGANSPLWEEYGLVFTTTAGQSSVILKMINNGIGGCGNDLAIDDIVFKSCGDVITIEDNSTNSNVLLCETETPFSTTLEAIPDYSVFNTHAYQWQMSSNGITWVDISGATNQSYSVSNVSSSTFFRVKVAESAINLANNSCNTISEEFEIFVADVVNSPISPGNVLFNCTDNNATLSVSTPNNVTVNWYDAAANGTLLATNTNTYVTNNETGVFYAEAIDSTTGCKSQSRTAISVTKEYPDLPIVSNNEEFNCITNEAVLTASVPANNSANWYDTNGNLLLSDSTIFSASNVGDYYVEAVNINTGCISVNRVLVTVFNNKPNAPISNGNVEIACSNNQGVLSVNVPSGVRVNWYDAAFGGTLLLENSLNYTTNIAGTYFAEAVDEITQCKSEMRTAITLSSLEQYPQVSDENLIFCEGETIPLDAGAGFSSYLWSTGETTQQIVVNQPGVYQVEVANSSNCSATKTIELTQINRPIIASVRSNGYQMEITTTEPGDFEYSLDNNTYQLSPIFEVEGGRYTVYVRERNACGQDSVSYIHFVIPKFFTPNNDGQNDTFNLKGLDMYATSEVHIFDRYGKLIIATKNKPFSWNGTFNNQLLPTSDYWYVIAIEDQVFRGHFTLKR